MNLFGNSGARRPPAGPRRRRVAQGTALGLVATTVAVLAINYDGSPIRDVDLNDGGVWVTNSSDQMMARLNSQAKELELGILTSQGSNAVFQEGASVQVFDDGASQPGAALRVADPVTGTAKLLELPGTVTASAAHGTVGLLDAKSGKVWIRRADRLEGFTPQQPVDVTVSPRSTLVLARSGAVLVADRAAGKVTSWRLDETGRPVEERSFDFEREFHDGFRVSAVGDVPVVLQEGKLLRAGGDALTVPGKAPVLQQPAPAGDTAYVATSRGLFSLGLDDDELVKATELEPGGTPAAPVVVDGCVYAAWAAPHTPNYQRTCGDDAPLTGEVKPMARASDLVFRSNRGVVVLNDTANGNAWLVQDGMTLVDNWPSVNPNAADPQVAKASDKQQTNKKNKPPTAKPDKFGARAGSTVLLPVTLNDIDPDGDILTVSDQPASAKAAELSVAGDGTRVQAKVASGAKGSFEFEYQISDGQPGHTADKNSRAKVTVTVFGPGTDKKPHLIEDQRNALTVAAGHEASTNVLAGWIDPEGDPLVLTDATSKGGEVTFRPDGTITFVDDGHGAGRERIEFTAQGGRAEAKGVVDVTVVAPAKATPVAVADRFAGPMGTSILLKPLANDTDPLGEQLTVPRLLVKGGGAEVTRNADGTATFRAERSGAYFLEYEAASSNGRKSDPTAIRVDVWPRREDNQSPVATRDLAALRQDGSALVDVLANDTDPDGDVLVVQGVRVPARWSEQVTASVVNKRFVRVQAHGALEGDPEFEYLLSDGVSDQAKGSVAVVTAPAKRNHPPSAVDDLVTVRAGSIVTIPVLANDEDRDGDRLFAYQPDLHDVSGGTWIEDGKVPVIATGSAIRVRVPDDGTTQMTIGYGVRDEHYARSDARLVINVRADDAKANEAPEPRPIEDRTVVGQRIRVPVDVFGADPDGDPVVFTGVETAPALGRISATGASWFEYEPFADTRKLGTDTFEVRVSDKYGATGIASVRIGVAPRSPENQPPAALDDEILVKPGRTIQYPVLQNDSDPDGDPLIIEDDQFQPPRNVTASLRGEVVEIDVPDLGKRSEVAATALYSITDGLGMSSTASLVVTARQDAPNHAPLAQDDVVPPKEMEGKAAGDSVDVDVLDNDGDLDGARSELELESVAAGSKVVGRELQVTLARKGQTVPYRITDATGESSFGFVYVAGTDTMPPMVNQATVPVESKAGETTTVELGEVTIVRPGRDARIGRVDTIEAANGDAKAKGDAAFTFHAPKDFHGPASVTLDVIDGKDLNDPTGLKSSLTYPITVLPSGNVPPEVRDTAVVVYAGRDGRTIRLDRLASDLNEDKLSFTTSDAEDGVRAEVSDDLLEISAEDDAPSGEQVLEVEVSDGTADPVVAHVRVTVIGSSGAAKADAQPGPPMQLSEIRIADGKAKQTETVDVRDAIVFDPFPGKGKEITSISASGPAPRPSTSGTKVEITPNAHGEVVVTYRLSDGSGDSARDAEGRIVVVVADVPAKPGPPTVAEGGPDSVLLTWRAPADNGSPIEKYVVRWNGGDQECTGTQCTIAGLDPGQEYTFAVAAVNGVGEGPESDASGRITPDTVPETMVAPVVDSPMTDRDGQLHLRWVRAESKGSDITGYELQSVPATSVRKVGASETTLMWTGLENGTEYQFQIRAVNERGEGPWSPLSDGQTPFTKPQPMTAPSVVASGNDNRSNGGYVEVSWTSVQAPQDGYDAVTAYDVQLFKDGAAQPAVQVPGTATARAFDVENGHSYTAKVRAVNRAGEGGWSGESSPVNTWDRASAPTNVHKVADCDGCTASTTSYYAKVGFTTPSDNGGYPVTSYNYRTADGHSGSFPAPSQAEGAAVTARIAFNSAQANQSVTITPVTSPPNQGATTGASGSGGSFDPYAKPKEPSASRVEGYRRAGFSFSCDGNGQTVEYLEWDRLNVSDSGRIECSPNGSKVWDPIEGAHSRCVRTRIKTAAGLSDWREHGCATANTPNIDISFVQGSYAGCSSPCYWVRVDVDGYIAGGVDYTVNYEKNGAACSTTYASSGRISIGSGGRGGERTNAYVSGSCGSSYLVKVSVTGNQPEAGGGYNTTTASKTIP